MELLTRPLSTHLRLFQELLEERNTGTYEISGREEGPMTHLSRLSHNAVAALSVLSMSGTSFISE